MGVAGARTAPCSGRGDKQKDAGVERDGAAGEAEREASEAEGHWRVSERRVGAEQEGLALSLEVLEEEGEGLPTALAQAAGKGLAQALAPSLRRGTARTTP